VASKATRLSKLGKVRAARRYGRVLADAAAVELAAMRARLPAVPQPLVLPPYARMDGAELLRRGPPPLHTVVHDIDCDDRICRRCGITQRDLALGAGDFYTTTPPPGNLCRPDPRRLVFRRLAWLPAGAGAFGGQVPSSVAAKIVNRLFSAAGTRLTESVLGLWRRMRDGDDVGPILADALEEAGCPDAELLLALRA
jgi:hypothetical protein